MTNGEKNKIHAEARRSMLADIGRAATALSEDKIGPGRHYIKQCFPPAALAILHSQFCTAARHCPEFKREDQYSYKIFEEVRDLLDKIEDGRKMLKPRLLTTLEKAYQVLASQGAEHAFKEEEE